MLKKNLFKKRFNKLVISITKGIESFFNFFSVKFSFKKNFSKSLNTIDQKLFLSIAVIFFTIISYFLIPAFYDENKIRAQLENQMLDQYNLKVKLDKTLKYGLFPKPHFLSKNTKIEYNTNDLAASNNTKIFISINNFFSSDNLKIKNLTFKQTDFKIKKSNFRFFIDLLNNDKSDYDINFLNSKFFYLDQNDDIIFLANLKKLDYLFQDSVFKKFISKINIFNIPISLEVKHNISEKKFFTEINSQPLRLNIKDSSNYEGKNIDGQLDFTIINKNKKINYSLKNNSLNIYTTDKEFTSDINIKPFFLSSNLKFYQIDLKKIFKDNSILVNFLKSEILNNKNLNAEMSISSKTLKDVNFLDSIKFKIVLKEGDLFIQNLRTTFKDSLIINLDDTQLIVDNNKLKFAGIITLEFIDANNFYSHFQIGRSDRKNIKKITFGFLFNLDDEFIEVDNLKIDENTNQNLEIFIDNFNKKKENILNKIIRKNFVKSFFKNL